MCYREEKFRNEGYSNEPWYDGLETRDKNRLCQREASIYKNKKEKLANQRRNEDYEDAKALCR